MNITVLFICVLTYTRLKTKTMKQPGSQNRNKQVALSAVNVFQMGSGPSGGFGFCAAGEAGWRSESVMRSIPAGVNSFCGCSVCAGPQLKGLKDER